VHFCVIAARDMAVADKRFKEELKKVHRKLWGSVTRQ
jgi:hypothetical protein